MPSRKPTKRIDGAIMAPPRGDKGPDVEQHDGPEARQCAVLSRGSAIPVNDTKVQSARRRRSPYLRSAIVCNGTTRGLAAMVRLLINGETHDVDAPEDMPLLWALRDLLRL